MATADFLVLLALGLALATTAFSATASAGSKQTPVAAEVARERVRELELKLIPQAHMLLTEHRKSCDLKKRVLQPSDKSSAPGRYEQRHDQPTSPQVTALMKRCAPQTRQHEEHLNQLLNECVALGGCGGV